VYLGGVFVLAAWGKILDPYSFSISIATYQMVPESAVNLMAIGLPWLELVAGVALIAGFWPRTQALLVNAMLVMFILAIWWALAHDLKMQCGCFASKEAEADISGMTVIRDLFWLGLGTFIYVADASRFGIDGLLQALRPKSVRGEQGGAS
jgi:uncharacterized membrane protein YphA (DoxX/SURF4 family)